MEGTLLSNYISMDRWSQMESDFKYGVEKSRKSPFNDLYFSYDRSKQKLSERVSGNKEDEIYEKVEKFWILLFSWVEENAGERKRVKSIENKESPININHHSLLWSQLLKEKRVIFSNFILLRVSAIKTWMAEFIHG